MMGRTRTTDTDLPEKMYRKHGAFYFVELVDGKQRWTWLGRELDSAIALYNQENKKAWLDRDAVWKRVVRCVQTSRRRATASGMAHTVLLPHLRDVLEAQNYRCGVTGIPFTHERREAWKSGPYMPSLDRIDSAHGYVAGNVRVVCLCVNYAMNEWGEDVLHAILAAVRRRRVLDVSQSHKFLTGPASSTIETAPNQLM